MKINGKRKGNAFELKIAKQIAEHIGLPYGKYIRRTPGSGSLLCRADLWIHERYRSRFPYFLELKNRATATLDTSTKDNWEVYKWYRDAEDKSQIDPDYDKDAPVAVLFKKNQCDPFILSLQADIKTLPHVNFLLCLTINDRNFVVIKWSDFLKAIPTHNKVEE